MLTDEEIVEGIRQGRDDAAAALVARFATPLMRYFAAALPAAGPAEDMAQEVFLRLVRTVRGEGQPVQSLPGLLFTMARRLALDHQRRAARHPAPEPLEGHGREGDDSPARELADPRAIDPHEAAARAEQWQLVQGALATMEPLTRDVILMRHVEGMTCPAIARALGIAEGTVWSQLHRGLNTLRERLNPRPATGPADTGRTARRGRAGRERA